MTEPLWRPSSERVEAAAITAFRRAAEERAGRALPDYFALHDWSVSDSGAFWSLCADHARLPFTRPPERIISDEPMPFTRWFEGATLNHAQALLHPPSQPDGAAPALLALDEAGAERRLTFAELRALVGRVQAALAAAGVGPGDRVAAYAANVPETVALFLACAATGAVFSSCSPDFGREAARARFGQIAPTVLVGSGGYRYGGRVFDTSATLEGLAADLGPGSAVALPGPDGTAPAGFVAWEEWLPAGEAEPEFAPLPFDHPLYILYSSGTTGLPKAIVHRAGGPLLALHREHALHCDIRPGDTVFYYTTCGWMMWNWLVGVLAQGATAVLYDGSPVHPDPLALWRLAERHRFTLFGTSAGYLHAQRSAGVRPGQLDLGALRTITSTGSPLSPAGFEYVYESVKADVHLASVSGGTDIVGCFMLGVPTLPVYAGQIQAPALGVDLVAFGPEGRPVVGEPGELVCRNPLPSMPLRFWNDPGNERYLEAYFSTFPGVWRHGDLIEITPERGVVVYGRSDATLNPGGVRIGTAEVYRPLEAIPEVLEAAAVGYRAPDGEAAGEEVWLFVVLAPGASLSGELEGRIRATIRRQASPRHVPRRVLAVSDLPRTRNGKVMELAVAALVNGRELTNRDVVANPQALEAVARALAGVESRD